MRRLILLTVVVLVSYVHLAAFGQSEGVDPRRRTPVVEVFEATRDSVVNIASTQVIEVRSPFGLYDFFDMRDPFLDGPRRRQIQRTSVGSGFVLHSAGYIITNAHVVARTAERKVIFADGSEYEADVVAIDEPHDLAVLKIDPGDRPLTPVPLGTSDDLMVGETVIAIGNPLGYQHTVTAGVVSAVDRTLPVSDQHDLQNLIQTDASINPGNSGGPLLNVLGELVGINTAIRADAQNIGFAIPVDQLRDLMPGMLDVERRYRIRIGLSVSPAGPARVTAVEPGSPADGQIEVGDTITAVGEQPITSGIDYHVALIGRGAGPLTLELDSGEVVSIEVTERPQPDGRQLLLAKLGLEVEVITPQVAQRVGIRRLRGLAVTGVKLASPADEAGLEPGDVLIQLGRHQPTNLDEVGELLEQVEAGDTIEVGVLRISGRTIYRAATKLHVR